MIDARRLDERLAIAAARPGFEISGLQAVVVDGGELVHEHCSGRRWIDPEGPGGDLPVDRDTKFRVASISKTVVGIGAMRLVEEGALDLGRDLSDYLGFPFRNPSWPSTPLTAAMLLSHCSSLRDIERYTVPFGGRIAELLGEEGRWATPLAGADASPGRFYAYCNLGYGILATAMERITGERFDRLMKRLVLGPLGLDAGWNVAELSDEALRDLGVPYRKADAEDRWDSAGPWRPQVDNHRGRRPAAGCAFREGFGPADLASYAPGTNGSLFSPQGGLRASARDIATVARLLLAGGALNGKRIISPASVRRMMTPRWTWDAARENGDLQSGGITRETGLALMHGTDSFDSRGGDRLLPGGGPRLWCHHADAYGLLGGLLLDPDEGFAAVYLIGGTAADPELNRGRHSGFFIWEEEIMEAILEESGYRGPRRS